MNADLVKIFYAEAAHRNPKGGPAQQRLHGHSYRLELLGRGTVDPAVGWVVDYAELKALFEPIYGQLDHAYLNDLSGLEADATVSSIQAWIEARLEPRPWWLAGVRVSIVGDLAFRPVRLPADTFRGFPERVRFTFEAAQSLPHLAEGHPCRKVHGHSYTAEVGAESAGALEGSLRALYDTLDHRYLNDVDGLEKATCEHIAAWVWAWLEARGVAPSLVTIQETATAQCLYRGT